jgi:hypothetical protein
MSDQPTDDVIDRRAPARDEAGHDGDDRSGVQVDFWVDPACPFCWMTARWLVEQVQPHRDVDVTWQPISLHFKNQPDEDSPFYEPTKFTLGLLRVMESIRATGSDGDVFRAYWAFGTRIHHDGDLDFEAGDVLRELGIDDIHAKAFDDESWDAVVRERMDAGIALVGNDVGTPIIAIENSRGTKSGYFGPVINRLPTQEEGLKMWDALVTMMDVEPFFELKRTRTGGLDLGERPTPR